MTAVASNARRKLVADKVDREQMSIAVALIAKIRTYLNYNGTTNQV